MDNEGPNIAITVVSKRNLAVCHADSCNIYIYVHIQGHQLDQKKNSFSSHSTAFSKSVRVHFAYGIGRIMRQGKVIGLHYFQLFFFFFQLLFRGFSFNSCYLFDLFSIGTSQKACCQFSLLSMEVVA